MARKKGPSSSGGGTSPGAGKVAERYTHPTETSPMRPDVGTQPQFRKKKTPATWRYDSSLSPALDWDGQNGARELGEWLLALIEKSAALPPPHTFEAPQEFRALDGRVLLTVRSLGDAVDTLKRLGRPFLNWAGKAERLSFDVPTLPLFVHERLSTKAIVETLVGHRVKSPQSDMWDIFGDPQHSIVDQTLRAYEYQDKWVNRLVLGDSLVVMNSLLRYEGLGGQVQMIYIDPPYGVKFGSNFQPFVRKRDVTHGDDEDLTREPEMVKAYRDTWELGLHSYLTYMRDRLLLARDLLAPSGSIFVQISDENVHHVRELMDEVFGAENFHAQINFKSTSALGAKGLAQAYDYILWYARDLERMKFRPLFRDREIADDREWRYVEDSSAKEGFRKIDDGEFRALSSYEAVFRRSKLTSSGYTESCTFEFDFEGTYCKPYGGKSWVTTRGGIETLITKRRLFILGGSPYFKQYFRDFAYAKFDNSWSDQPAAESRLYVVQTANKFVQRCLLMTTDPGDLVLDPTCGSGTTAYVAEQWGRRWITIDTSRVPLALARQRLLTATFPWYELKDDKRGPASGFVYLRKQNKKGEEVGGIVPHVTLKSIANNEPPEEEVLVDRPEVDNKYVRVTGPFAVEATIPTPVDWEEDGIEDSGARTAEDYGSFVDRMIEVLRRSPVLHVGGGKTVKLWNVRRPAKSLSLSAEALQISGGSEDPPYVHQAQRVREGNADERPVAFVFGPENGSVSEKLVHAALKEADIKRYAHLYVIGFAIQAHARELVEKSTEAGFPPATYVQATPDLMMGDLLKTMRSSQIFSVCGLPEVKIDPVKPDKKDEPVRYQVLLLGLDTFDPTTMQPDHRAGDDVPAWFLDTDYNDLCFHVSQAFFPRTSAWEGLRKALKADYDDSVWDHLAGTVSAPFEAGEHRQVAVKVIDDRGNELLVVRPLPQQDL